MFCKNGGCELVMLLLLLLLLPPPPPPPPLLLLLLAQLDLNLTVSQQGLSGAAVNGHTNS